MKKIELWVTPSQYKTKLDLWEYEPAIEEDTGLYALKWIGIVDILNELGEVNKPKKITVVMED